MSVESDTSAVDAREHRGALTSHEQAAVAHLRAAGWSMGELTLTMQCGESAIRRAVERRGGVEVRL